MAEIRLVAQRRDVLGKKVKSLRQEGIVPAIVYGQGIDPVSISVPTRELDVALRRAGATSLIVLEIGEETKTVLVREVQRDILTREIIHADLYEVSMTETITTEIPVALIGAAPAVEAGIGVLVHGLNSVEVECLPGDLVNEIAADLSVLVDLQTRIVASDLRLPPGITLLSDPDEMVATITALRAEEEEEEVEAVAAFGLEGLAGAEEEEESEAEE